MNVHIREIIQYWKNNINGEFKITNKYDLESILII